MRLAVILLLIMLAANIFASDAIAAYRSNTGSSTTSSPKIRFWSSSGVGSWGSEIELATAGSPVRYAVARYSPINQKIALVTLSDDGFLDGYVCFTGCTTSSSWTVTNDIGRVWTTAASQRRYDIRFETATGDLMLAYGVWNASASNDIAYKVLPNASADFSGVSEQYLDDNSSASNIDYTWIAMERDPVASSEEIILVGFDLNGSDIMGAVWGGNSWGFRRELSAATTAAAGGEVLAVAYAADGSKGMMAGGTGTAGNLAYAYWDGSNWVPTASFDVDTVDVNDLKWVNLKPDPATDDIMALYIDSGSDLGTSYWDGTSWTIGPQHDNTTDSNAARLADFEWNTTSSNGVVVWDTDTTSATLSYRSWTGSWSAASTISSYATTGAWLTLFRNPNSTDVADVLGLRLNAVNFDIGSFRWQGGPSTGNFTNYGDSALTADATVTTFEAYSLSFLLATDSSGPSVTSTSVNSTSVSQNDNICVNVTTNDLSGVSAAWAQITFPNGTITNFTMDESGCNAGTAGDLIYGVSINVGATAGSLVVNTSFANDSFDNTGLQSPYPNIQVTISAGGAFVDTSIDASTISFGPLDPARFNMNASENPINLTNTGNSNVAVDVYLNTTKMTSGANTMNCNNLSVSSTIVNLTSTNFSCSLLYINGTSANQGFYENVAISSTVKLYFWHDVPSGQASGSYTATVRVHSVADGNTP